MEPFCPLGTTRCIPHEKFPRKPYSKSFIDQVCSVKMVGYWPRSFFAREKELGQYPAILTSHLVNNPYLLDFISQCHCLTLFFFLPSEARETGAGGMKNHRLLFSVIKNGGVNGVNRSATKGEKILLTTD